MDVFKIDVTGDDILGKGYAVLVVHNVKDAYAYKFPSDLQADIRDMFRSGRYGFSNKRILKPRVYCAVLALVLKQMASVIPFHEEEFELHICNDFDGHQNDIIQILREHAKSLMIFNDITSDNYHFTRHPKKSRIQALALRLHKGDWDEINKVSISSDELHNLIANSRFRRNSW